MLYEVITTHIIRNLVREPARVFEDIVVNTEILQRAQDIAHYYDDLIRATQAWQLLGDDGQGAEGNVPGVNLRALKQKLYRNNFV